MTKRIKKVGDTIEVNIKRGLHTITIKGKIKQIRKNWGTCDYLVTSGTTEEFWTRAE